MSKKMRFVVTLVLLLAFTAGTAQAAPWSFGGKESAPLGGLWGWIVSVWTEGPGMDPNGGETKNEGPSMDPDGLTTGDEGPGMDPNG